MRFSLNPDSKFLQFLTWLCDLVILNAVFLLTCLPVFTIGAANAALYTVVFPMDTPKEGPLLRTYFRAFRENFRQGTAMGLLFLLFFAATFVNLSQFSQVGNFLGTVMRLLLTFVLMILVLVFSYAFPLQSQFCNTVRGTLKNALLLGIAHLPRTLAVMVINCFPWALLLLNLYTFARISILWIFVYFSAAAYCNSRLLNKVFAPYRESGNT